MTDINVKIRFERAKEDITKLKKILEEMDGFETTARETEEGKKKVEEELRRRLREAGLSSRIFERL